MSLGGDEPGAEGAGGQGKHFMDTGILTLSADSFQENESQLFQVTKSPSVVVLDDQCASRCCLHLMLNHFFMIATGHATPFWRREGMAISMSFPSWSFFCFLILILMYSAPSASFCYTCVSSFRASRPSLTRLTP